MPDFQPTSEVIHLSYFFSQACPFLLIMIFATFHRIQCLSLQLGQFFTML
jgi:hypothetical protein